MIKTTSRSLINVAITANILEWYDFSISGFLAIVLGQVFFAEDDALIAIIKSFSVFAASYLIRPLGSMAFGYLGNRRGLGFALRHATLWMAIPTILMGLLPTYWDIGYSATILLVLLRLIQGFAAGGELPLSAYYVTQQANRQEKRLMSALVAVGTISGMLLASFFVLLLENLFSSREIGRWAWRIPFLLSMPLLLVILKARRGIICHDFLSMERRYKTPVRISNHVSILIHGMLLVAALNVGFYALLIWLPSYAEIFLKYSRSDAYFSNTLALGFYVGMILISGFLFRGLPYKKILMTSLWLITLLVYPFFLLILHFHTFALLLSVQCVFAILYGCISSIIWIVLYDLFKENLKNFGVAIAFTLPTTVFGGTAPLVCTYLANWDRSFPAFYIILFSLLALPVVGKWNCLDKECYFEGIELSK